MDTSPFPVRVCRLVPLFFGLSISVSRCSLVRSYSHQLFRCYISCIMCTCSSTYDTPHILPSPPFPLPLSPFFDSFPRPSALLKQVSWPLSLVKTKAFSCANAFPWIPLFLWGIKRLCISLTTLPGSDKIHLNLHLFCPPFRSLPSCGP